MNIVVLGRQKINFEIENLNVDINSQFALRGATDLTGGTFTINLRRTCVMITGITDVCEENVAVLPLDISVPFSAISIPSTNTGADFLSNSPNPSQLYGPAHDSNYIQKLNDLLLIQQVFSVPGSITYKFNYGPNIEKGQTYEGVLHISSSHFPFNGIEYYTYSVKIQIFGQVVYRQTNEISSPGPYTIHFGFINTVNANSEVSITYSTNVVPILTPTFINFLEFGLV